MSIQFSNTTTKRGLIQLLEKELGYQYGDISGNSTRLLTATADINNALDNFTYLAIKSSGRWQWDDSNQTDYGILKANIVSGQRDYPFTTDETGNLILDVYKVLILPSATATVYEEITPVDQQTELTGIATEDGATGVPSSYDKTANSILFADATPNYNATNGIKMFINREASYFATTDTTKKPGIPGILHEYPFLKAALVSNRRNKINNPKLEKAVLDYEGDETRGIQGKIERYYSRRSRDERFIMTPKRNLFI